MARGIDVHCYYQKDLNWAALDDVGFVWVKVSDGGSAYTKTVSGVTYRPDTQVAGAKSRDLPVGGYHYAELSPAPETQADVLLAEVRRLGATGVVPMLDLEAPFMANAAAKTFGVAFCNRVAASGFRPAVYMSASMAKTLRPDQWGIPGLVIVIARYGAKPEAAGPAQYLGPYDVHQYASDGALPGSTCDLDESYTTNHLIGDSDMTFPYNTQVVVGPPFTTPPTTKQWGDIVNDTRNAAMAAAAGVAALSAAVAAIAAHPDITPEQIEAAIDAAVAAHVTVTIGVTPTEPAA